MVSKTSIGISYLPVKRVIAWVFYLCSCAIRDATLHHSSFVSFQTNDMAKATFVTCCCCVELRLGCLIWGYSELAFVVYYLIKLYFDYKYFGGVVEVLKKYLSVSKEQKIDKETEEVIRSVGIALLIFLCLIWGIKVFFNILFLRGLHMNNRAHVGAYLIYTFTFIIVSLITYVVSFMMLATLDKLKIPGFVMGVTVIGIIVGHVLMAYFWLVIRSQYCNMAIKPNQAVQYRS